MVAQIIEASFVLVMAFLILTHSGEFDQAASSVGKIYVNAVQVLQGRG